MSASGRGGGGGVGGGGGEDMEGGVGCGAVERLEWGRLYLAGHEDLADLEGSSLEGNA
jgi:hypothetical protein